MNATNSTAMDANGTANDLLVPRKMLQATAADSVLDSGALIGDLKIYAGNLRDRVGLLSGDIGSTHLQLQDRDLHERAGIKARKGVSALLEELAVSRGMSWSSIARAAGVSVGAVRKWRNAGAATGENRLALGLLAALLDLLEAFAVEDPAGWLEMPLLPEYTITALDLYCAETRLPLLEYAGGRITATQLLDDFDPVWRERFRSGFKVYRAADGDLAIHSIEEA